MQTLVQRNSLISNARFAGLNPNAVVIVATIRALKMNGGVPKTELSAENLAALEAGIANIERHVENVRQIRCSSCSSNQ